jgi:2-polyprenyl-3-methyl-5-hydroxy-6-metoxy-1,4-benzoquinol methylase
MSRNESVSGGPCRFCGADLEFEFLDLGMTPLCETFLTKEQLNHTEQYYPLRVYVCGRCFLVQLQEYVSPQEIFSSEYPYFASYSDSWLRHAKAYADLATDRFSLSSRSQVVEIASNDGYLLQYFIQRGIPVLGVEPARNVAQVATEKGIPTVTKFFGCDTARELVGAGKQADLLLGNNVLAHVPQLNDFVEGLRILLKPTGVITMEFPHLARLIAGNEFDTIYHEHFSYLSFHTVEKIFAAHGLTLFDVEELPSHGGSLRIYARHTEDTSKPVLKKVSELRVREEIAGLTTLTYYAPFSERVKTTKWKLLAFLIDAKQAGKTIVGYGAPGKGNTLLNYCGIRTDFLDYTVDRNPAKHGKYTPGTHIPIYPVERIRETKPDYVLILPWNLKKEVMEQMSYIREWGGVFAVPIPEVTIVRSVD